MQRSLIRKILFFGVVLLLASFNAFSQSQQLQLLAHVNSHTGYSDCWGYTSPNGDEYALLGVSNGVSIIDITDPANATEVDFVPWVSAPPYGWYDIKTYHNYMYVTSEGSTSFLVVDLSPLPNPASVVGQFPMFSSGAHNNFIDTDTGILYGVEDFHFNPCLRIIDIASPGNPMQLSTINPSNNGTDSHDAFAQDSVLYIAEGSSPSIGIFDVSDPANPSLIQRLNIPAAGYVHQVWVDEDNHYMITTEETANHTVKLWNIQNISNITLSDDYLGGSHLAHNAYLKGNYAYISHYESGLKVVDISNPNNITEVGYYDTYPQGETSNFNGAWGTYPFFNSGKVLVSDIQTGLYVVYFGGAVTHIENNSKPLTAYSLGENYPNPFNPTTTISYQISRQSQVRIEIYNMLGQKVRTLLNDRKEPGAYEAIWNGKNDSGAQLSSGVYLYRMVAGDFVQTRKMVLMK
jgi:choice-of-anchor B domain-containing protein